MKRPSRWHKLMIALMAAFCCMGQMQAQSPSTEGTDFYVAFLFNYQLPYDKLTLVVTGQHSCTGTVSNPRTGWSTNFSVTAQQVTVVDIPYRQAYASNNRSSSTISNTGLHVTTTDTVSLYAANYQEYTYDISFVLPTQALRDEYIVQNYYTPSGTLDESSGFIIVATEDNTEIDITPTAKPRERSNTNPYTITLQKGQIYQTGVFTDNYSYYYGGSGNTMSGTHIKARDCKPIAVFGGNSETQVPDGNPRLDHLFEQMMPVAFWGQRFIVTPTAEREEDRVRITSSENNCEIYINGSYTTTLQAYQTYEFTLRRRSGAAYIETTKPAETYLYTTGCGCPNGSSYCYNIGDPSMVLINPIEQQMKKVTFSTFRTTNIRTHYVNIVTENVNVSGMRIDGTSIASQFQTVTGNPTYSYAQVSISDGAHTLECTTSGGFVAHVYGLGVREAYCYAVGSSTEDLRKRVDINRMEGSASVSSDNREGCVGDEFNLKLLTDYEITAVNWDFGDGGTASETEVRHSYSAPGSYSLLTILSLTTPINNCRADAYSDTLRSTITIHGTSQGETTASICDNNSYRWNNQNYNRTGQYSKTLTATNGCDSLDKLDLTVLSTTDTTITEYASGAEMPYTFGGYTFYHTTDTVLRLTTSQGCDSIIHYKLNVSTALRYDTTICQNSLPLSWRGATFSAAGSTSLTLPGDTAIVLTLHVNNNTYRTQRDTVVENQLPVAFAGLTFSSQQGDTTLIRVNAKGCDSLITYSLHVWPNQSRDIDSALCEDLLPITWNGITIGGDTTLQATLAGCHGEDSVVTLRIHTLRNTNYEQRDTAVENQLPIQFAGLTFSDSQPDTLILRANAAGCDSLITYSLHVWHNVNIQLDSTFCSNYLPLTWNGLTFNGGETQSVTLPGPHGEDSVITMCTHILVNTSYTQRDTVVENQLPVRFADVTFRRAQRDTTMTRVNAAGCDSLITYSLHVWPNIRVELDSTLCENYLPLTWNGIAFTTDETHQTTLAGQHGEDSILTMRTHILVNTTATRRDTIVENQLPYSAYGLSFSSGQADTTLVRVNAAGCDSLITYSLHVWHNLAATDDSTICDDQLPLTWNGVTFTNAATQNATLTAMHGEDSVVSMTLTVNLRSYYAQHDTVVENDLPIIFNHVKYNAAQRDTLMRQTNAVGCDSLITYSLHVWPNLRVKADSALCEALLPLSWNGIDYYNDSSATVTLTGQHGEDSILTMYVYVMRNTAATIRDTVAENSLPVAFAGLSFSDAIADTTIIRRNAEGCDSIIHYSLHVWRNIYSSFDTTVCEHLLPFDWEPFTFAQAGTQTLTLTAAGSHGEDSTVTKTLYLYPDYHDTVVDTVSDLDLPYSFLGHTYRYTTYNDGFQLTTIHGCDSILSYSVIVDYHVLTCDPYLQFPNLVTPNGDGVNDRFEIANLLENDCYEKTELYIYDRWGRRVFSTRNISKRDDFWQPDDNINAGTYYFVFIASGVQGHTRRSGVIEVVR